MRGSGKYQRDFFGKGKKRNKDVKYNKINPGKYEKTEYVKWGGNKRKTIGCNRKKLTWPTGDGYKVWLENIERMLETLIKRILSKGVRRKILRSWMGILEEKGNAGKALLNNIKEKYHGWII